MKTRVSVIIPIHNVQEFLGECIESVLEQTLINKELTDGYERNLQIILVDDGSTDDSGKIAKGYADSFDNIEYFYIENQGVGYARNYGCEFAEGDYIIFLDSDDILRPYAYERMYDLAIKNESNMVICGVWRFNSKNYWDSDIHSIAMPGMKEITHITESPELLYDSTVWNKLINHSFWKKYEFKFPEDILYEDIPVAFLLHYYTNNVSIIYENCYLWRVRESSKSITQKTNEIVNLKHRIQVMKSIDAFFKDNIKNENLLNIKNYKWLSKDLMIFINKLNDTPVETSNEVISLINDYIKENINLKYIDQLNELDRLKYNYLIDNNLEKLTSIINFQMYNLHQKEIYSNNGHTIVNVDKELFGESNLCIDKFIENRKHYVNYIDNISIRKKQIIIKGFTIIPGLKDDDFNDRDYSFYLVNSESHKKLPLKFKDTMVSDLSTYNIRYGNNISYDAAGYEVNIPFSTIANNNDFMGENKLLVCFKQNDIVYNYFAILKWNLKFNKLKAKLYKNNYFFIDYDLNDELIINYTPIDHIYDNCFIENDQLCIPCHKDMGKLFLCYEGLLNNKKMPLVYNNQKKYYTIKIDEILNQNGQIRYDNGEPIINKRKKPEYLHSSYGQIIINHLRDYYFDISKTENLSLVSKINAKNEMISIETELYSINKYNLLNAYIFCKDDKNYEEILISKGNLNNNNETITFKFSFLDKFIDKLYNKNFDIYVKYECDEQFFTTQLYMKNSFRHNYSNDLIDFSVYRSGKGNLRIKSKSKWNEEAESFNNRKKIINTKYAQFRKLPINPKRIMFESMWGKQFSCNPRYLYEYINENFPDYECIWSFLDEREYCTGNAIPVKKYSLKYYYYLATSKFLCDNVNFESEFIKREDQVYIQTMHGTPLKTLGLDVEKDFNSHASRDKFIKDCQRWDIIPVQSDYVSNLTERCFKYKNELLRCGYPRTDILYSKNNQTDINNLKIKLHIPLNKKVILYAPTWRYKDNFQLMLDLKSLKDSLSDEYILILRLHHFARSDIKNYIDNDFVYDFSNYYSIEELYLVSDILITDYSSAMFDYAILDRPILLFTYDMENYVKDIRGTYFDLEEFNPGPILFTSKEVEQAIINIDETEKIYRKNRNRFREKFNQYENGNSSKTIFNQIIKNEENNEVSNLIKKIYSKLAYWFIKTF
ncbi:MAG: glycosyltransferase [Methanobrevibacter thaueri]|jgi:CDP-glycerol glycerophosphotransferase|uniref:bifunctional glycosyltransferase/CDP-glycerol:glycerophosphate glycerophosphotransferase n=1 Tax=Methanobrevibacter thaueri TaxID=190975 RepID=UPI0026EF6B91|nr:CDP-glycerol glycerophosphotransferase family protein [Methanobrevibacter thaueri]MBE6496401.1 glycosyltransferase [Methanobrevibacter thaueri]